MFDLSEHRLYELKFWGKWSLQNQSDGFQVEYSTDSGDTWQQLGDNEDPGWYNYLNANQGNVAFPISKSYFTGNKTTWTQYINDISFLGGKPHVSFRFVFRSNYEVQSKGLAIDDFEVTQYEGELKTTITNFTADYTSDQEVTVLWTTGIEYQCRKFILERSYTGLGFTQVAELPASGVFSTYPHDYMRVDQSLRKVIYYRLNVINENPDIPYSLQFYSDTVVVRRDVDPGKIYSVLTNQFENNVTISFSSVITQEVIFRLFDTSGKLVKYEEAFPNSVAYTLDWLDLPPGVYILNVQVGNDASTTYKLFTTGN